jgi:hypothetical protein
MRGRLTLAVVAAFVGGYTIAAHAQAPPAQAPVVLPDVGFAGGTGVGNAAAATIAGAAGAGQRRAGSGGIADSPRANAVGGITGTTRAGTGGIREGTRRGAGSGGVNE